MKQLFRLAGFIPYILVLFLNAFVDLGHKIIVQNTVFKIYDGELQTTLIAIVNALILLPFVLVFTPAGFLSDRFHKPRVMQISAWAAVALTLSITFFYYQGWFVAAFIMTFLLALQSAFYSPAKYGYIKEMAGQEHLTAANAIVQATTIISILGSTFAFSILFEGQLAGQSYNSETEILALIAPLGWVLVACSVLELLFTYQLPQKIKQPNPTPFDWTRYTRGQYLSSNLKMLWNNEIIRLSIIGLALFWAISQVLVAAFPAFAKEVLQEENTIVIQGLMACSGIGIMIGSLLAGSVSRDHIETGLIPIGALGFVLGLFILPQLESAIPMALAFILLGTSGGLFIVPLNALIQFHAEDKQRGIVLAGNNWVHNITMLAFLGLTIIASSLGFGSISILSTLIVIAALGAIYTVYHLPQSLIRYVISFFITRLYRIKVQGFDNVPAQGPVLMLGNHISWLDWAIVQISCPRSVHFVMHRDYYNRWYLRWFFDFFHVVPIASGQSKQALETINQYLKAGKLVCLFPEGSISRTGQLGQFKRGYERTVEDVDGVILPFYLHGMWGSRFSRASDKLQRNRSAKGIRRDIIVAFGNTLPIDTRAEELKRHIFDLSVETWQAYAESLKVIPQAWINTTKRMGYRSFVADTQAKKPLSSYRALTMGLLFSRLIEKYSAKDEQNIGLLLPTSSVGMLMNMAVMLRGRTVVNLNYTASPKALKAAIAKADIRTVYTSKLFLQKLKNRGIDLEDVLAETQVYELESLKDEISKVKAMSTYLIARLSPARLLYTIYGVKQDIQAPAAILFSSGSEGSPKGIVLTHRNLMTNIKQISDVLDVRDNDVVMANLPLFHAFGLTVTSMMPLVEGVPVLCHPDPTDVLNIARGVAKYEVTVFFGTSTFFRLFTRNRRIHPTMFASLRIVVAGAEKLSDDVRQAFQLKFNKEIYEGYGATEVAPVASVNIPDHIETTSWHLQIGQKYGTVGLPLPGTSFRIVDPESLTTLPTREDGLILISGPQVMPHYLDDKAKTNAALVELDGQRWYKTGDKGHVDEDGFLVIVDRYSRFAKIAGEMVSLGAVETTIRQVLDDAELELVAVNLPDGKKGEKIVLLVADEERDLQALRKQLIKASMNPLMIPSTYYTVDEVPKLGAGKTDFTNAKKLALSLDH